jgi:hypothetical protein
MAARVKKIIRNKLPLEINIRLGSKKDPYYIQLKRRGNLGDTHVLSGDLFDHELVERNIRAGNIEVITKAEYDDLEYFGEGNSPRPTTPNVISADGVTPLSDGGIIRESETSKVVAVADGKGNFVRPGPGGAAQVSDTTNPGRSQAPGTTDNPVKEIGVVRRKRNA